jgi:hypothetical protein
MVVTLDDLDRARAAALNCLHDVVEARDKARVYRPLEEASPSDAEWQQKTFLRWASAHFKKMRDHVGEAKSALSEDVLDAIEVASTAPNLPLVKLASRTWATWHKAAEDVAEYALLIDLFAAMEAAHNGLDYASLLMKKVVQIGDTIDETTAAAHIKREWAAAVASLRKAGSADSADTSRLFPGGLPDDMDLQDLVIRLDANKSRKPDERKSKNQIAREFFNETKECQPKTRTYLRQIRRMSERGEIIL